jgi:acetyltransferase-like isoleucine patch superfamily enzyme
VTIDEQIDPTGSRGKYPARTLLFLPVLAIRIRSRLRGLALKAHILAAGGHAGAVLSVGHGVHLLLGPGARVRVGNNVGLGHGVLIIVGKRASLIIGDNVRIAPYTIIAAEQAITIGDRAQIGEHCSVRDHEHDPSAPSMYYGPLRHSPVRVGEDSWIGRGVALLKGANIGPGAVVGANAVVRGAVPENTVAAGVPARVLHRREAG